MSNVKSPSEKLPKRTYPQYRLTIPGEFVDEHGREVYLIADKVGMFLPDEASLMRILITIPEMRDIIDKQQKGIPLTEDEILKVLQNFPELRQHILKETNK